jgi:hypothetical protein
MMNDYYSHREQLVSRPIFDDFRDVISAASDHLKDLQRPGQNVTLFQSLVPMLPDPNDLTFWKPALLDINVDEGNKGACGFCACSCFLTEEQI